MTKVISQHWELLNYWKNELRCNRIIQPFNNRFFSPVYGMGVADLLHYLVKAKESGTFQVGGSEEMSYSEFCLKIFENNEFAKELIQPKADLDEWRGKLQTPNLVTLVPEDYVFNYKIYELPNIEL